MFPFQSNIRINRLAKDPIYQQIADQLIFSISEWKLGIGEKLRSSRALRPILGVHRKTITQGFDDDYHYDFHY